MDWELKIALIVKPSEWLSANQRVTSWWLRPSLCTVTMSHNTTLLIIKPPNDPWKEISRPLNVHKVQPVQLLLTSVTARHVLNNRCFPVWVDIPVCKFAACKLDELLSSTPQGLYRKELERKGHPCLAIRFKCNQAKIVQLIPLIQSYKQSSNLVSHDGSICEN